MRFLHSKFQNIKPYTPGEQLNNPEVIKLNTNENPYPTPANVIEAATKAAATLSRYSDPTAREVIEPLAAHFGVKPEEVFVGNGSDEVLSLLFQGFTEEGINFADLTYGFYEVYRQYYQCKGATIPLQKDFTLKLTDFNQTKGTIILANPNAPTGLVTPKEDLLDFIRKNPKRLIIVDEAYGDFADESIIKEAVNYENVVVVGTFSKSRHMAGARLGFAVANAQRINELNRLKFSTNPYNVNSMTIACGKASLANQAYVDECVQKVIATRTWISQQLTDLGFEVLPSYTNFIFVRHPKLSGQDFYQQLKKKNILIRWFDQDRIRDFCRVSIGTDEEMHKFLNVTTALLERVR